jgi:hypothetical protein
MSLPVESTQIERDQAPRAPKSSYISLRGATMIGLHSKWTSLMVKGQFDDLLFRDGYLKRVCKCLKRWIEDVMMIGLMPSWKKSNDSVERQSSLMVM